MCYNPFKKTLQDKVNEDIMKLGEELEHIDMRKNIMKSTGMYLITARNDSDIGIDEVERLEVFDFERVSCDKDGNMVLKITCKHIGPSRHMSLMAGTLNVESIRSMREVVENRIAGILKTFSKTTDTRVTGVSVKNIVNLSGELENVEVLMDVKI